MTNDTVGANSAQHDGGGIKVVSGVASLNNLTVAHNTSDSDHNGIGQGGGLLRAGGSVILSNSILAFNTDDTGTGPDCDGSITSAGYNLRTNATGCSLSATGDTVNGNPLLWVLVDNGGGTPTYALLPGSPAIDAGNPALADGTSGHCAPTDQRGVPRPTGAACDQGAFEAAVVADLAIYKTASANNVFSGQLVTYTLAVYDYGPQAAVALTVTDVLPASLAYSSVDAAGWACGYDAGTRTVTCTRASLAVGGPANIQLAVTTIGAGIQILNSATVAAASVDLNPGANTSSVYIRVLQFKLYLPLVRKS